MGIFSAFFSGFYAESTTCEHQRGTGSGGAGVRGPEGTPRGGGGGGSRDGAGLTQPGWRLGPLEGGAGGPGGRPALAQPTPRQGSAGAPGVINLGHDAPTQVSGMTRAEAGGRGTAGAPPCAATCAQAAASSAAQRIFMAACSAPGMPRPLPGIRGCRPRVAPGPGRTRDGSSVRLSLAACPGRPKRPALNPAGYRCFSPPRPSARVRC
jgi:hypothetical protein